MSNLSTAHAIARDPSHSRQACLDYWCGNSAPVVIRYYAETYRYLALIRQATHVAAVCTSMRQCGYGCSTAVLPYIRLACSAYAC